MTILTARRARALAAGVSAAALASVWVPTAGAAGTPKPDLPGTPPATVEVTTKEVFAGTQVTFQGAGWLSTGGQPQQFMIKFDDHGVNGIGPYTANADGTIGGTVAMVPPASATLKQREDYAPADLGTPGRHWLRFLAGWNSSPARSLHAEFTVVAAPEAPAPDPGTGTPAAPQAPETPAGEPLTPPSLASGPITRAGGRLAVRVRGGDARAGVAITIRTAGRVRLAPGTRPRQVLLARLRTAVAPGGVRVLRPRLTAAGRRVLANGPVRARITLVRAGAGTVTTTVPVRP